LSPNFLLPIRELLFPGYKNIIMKKKLQLALRLSLEGDNIGMDHGSDSDPDQFNITAKVAGTKNNLRLAGSDWLFEMLEELPSKTYYLV